MATTRRRRAAQVDRWSGALRDEGLDGMFASMQEAAKSSLNNANITTGADGEGLVVGLPLPALALRYVFQSTVFPLSRILQIAGPEGSCKSAFLYDVMRWHLMYGGGAVLMENENKDAAALRNSVLQRNPIFMRRMTAIPTNSLDEWQRALTFNLTSFRGALDAPGGPGRTVPVCFGIDSLTATDTEYDIAKTQQDGAASMGYARQAGLIARYMRQGIVGGLRGYPFTVAGTNHLKPGTDQMGRPTANIPGGKAVPFMATFMIEMNRIADIDKAEYGGIKVKIKLAKNSMGWSRKVIEADFIWWQQPQENGPAIQQHMWDWDTASIDMLVAFSRQKAKKTLYNNLMDIVDLHVPRAGYVYSTVLGISREAPVLYRTAGALLEQRPELLDAIYSLLSIGRFYPFQPGLDYVAMLQAAHATSTEEARTACSNPSSMPALDPDELDPNGATDTEE